MERYSRIYFPNCWSCYKSICIKTAVSRILSVRLNGIDTQRLREKRKTKQSRDALQSYILR